MTNTTKAWFFLGLHSLLFLVLGHWIGGQQGLLWALALSLSINSFIYFYGDKRVLLHFETSFLEGQDPWGLQRTTTELASLAHIPAPKIRLLHHEAPQILAVGRNWHSGTILITTGLLERLNHQELRASIAYQIASIQRMDTLFYSIASLFLGLLLNLSLVIDRVYRSLTGIRKPANSAQTHPTTHLVAPLLGALLRLILQPQQIYTKDKMAAEWLGSPRLMAEVLWKMDSYRSTLPISAPVSLSHMFLVNPLTEKGWNRYLRSQPKVSDRIQRLIGSYPL